ncbi:hypothetical protein EUX98_g1999 [Antrodiella citrinella]|uniref:Uncharacterized protein n=1 Tax=Antrodiella citrinella TaxID=2447956 RepID=A0A4S4N055_9APHY|nr:hypothetical protein EUX98_g1999 [Antrodiella citrinella]
MPVLSKVAIPFTPIMRRFLADVFKPTTLRTLGKRNRDGGSQQGSDAPHERPQLFGPGAGHLPNCVALQNDDTEEDAVVVTALNIIPFCCHADLLSMNRDDLVRVADTLNFKLPLAMQIDTSAPRSDVFIRNSIELLVGIRRTVPPTPKPNRSMCFVSVAAQKVDGDEDADHVPPTPASPLANRSNRLHNFSFAHSTPLAALDEEDEDVGIDEDEVDEPEKRLRKRRRILLDSTTSATPSPTTRALLSRSQSQRTPRSNINSPFRMGTTQVFRSQSQKLPRGKIVSNYRNVTLTRGRGGVRTKHPTGKYQNTIILTSTPKKRKRVQDLDSESTDSFSEHLSSISFPSPPALSPVDPSYDNRRADGVYQVAAADVTAGLEGMSMADEGSGSDMDISL